ncbi:MAG: histidine kinase [Parabacteroides merdae]
MNSNYAPCSQMNPHFIFNALSSIQNLINCRPIQEANKYLIDFTPVAESAGD